MVTPHALRSPGEPLLGASLIALLGMLLFLACNDDSKEVEVVGPLGPSTEEVGPVAPTTEDVSRGPLSPATVPLPFSGTVSSNPTAFAVTQTGGGRAGEFRIQNSNSGSSALVVSTNGRSNAAVNATNTGTGEAAFFFNASSANTSAVVHAISNGMGAAVQAQSNGTGVHAISYGRAGIFEMRNAGSAASALEAITRGRGLAVFGVTQGSGTAALFNILSASNSQPVIWGTTNGTGPGLRIDQQGSTGELALFRANGANRIRFTHAGKGIFNGGTQTGGADVAEAMAVEGRTSAYEPGDVLVISTRSDRTVEKAGEPYSTRVIGVYAIRPGVLLTERGVDESLEGLVPVGVVGIIPTKVTAENGPIRRGDLLVSARTPGYAMRADPDRLRFGMVLGKALGEWEGPDKGVIPVLINVK